MSEKNEQQYNTNPMNPANVQNGAQYEIPTDESEAQKPKPQPSFGIIDEGSRFTRLQPAHNRK